MRLVPNTKSNNPIDDIMGQVKQQSKGFMGWFNQQSKGIKAVVGIGAVCCLGLFLLVVIGGIFSPEQTNNTLTGQDVKVTPSGYGSYDLTATITPNKDFSYLEMVLVWYDSTGAVMDKDSLAWNINDVKAGQPLKATASSIISGNTKPSKFDMIIYDSSFSDNETKAIYKQTYTI
jgi:hypothetical protein